MEIVFHQSKEIRGKLSFADEDILNGLEARRTWGLIEMEGIG